MAAASFIHRSNGLTKWRDRWIGLRNLLVANPRFQNWVASCRLTRPIAHKRARALFDLCAGFVYSQTLVACVQLRVFERLRVGPLSEQSLAEQMSLSKDSTRRLMRAAASLDLVRILPGERYALADLGAATLANPSIAAFVEHHALLYEDLRDPVALLRGGTTTRLSKFWSYSSNSPSDAVSPPLGFCNDESVSAYSALMSQSQALIADDILDAYDLAGRGKLLDVGGGEGAFVAATAARSKRLELVLFDLPAVAERARGRLTALGLAARVEVVGGDFLRDALPRGADIVSLIRIVHDHDDDSALRLLHAVRAALDPGGTIVIAEPMTKARRADAVCDAYFGFYLRAMGRGRARSIQEHEELLQAARFSQIRVTSTRRPMLATVITATAV
jgi:demethylspheroidene O-methyltransferase